MFGIGMPELLLILAVALIILGPKKLPEIARSLGKAMGEFKRATSDLKQTIEHEAGLNDVRDSLRETHQDLQRAYNQEEDGPAAPTQTEMKESGPDDGGPTEPEQAVTEPTPDEQAVTEPTPDEQAVTEPTPDKQAVTEPTPGEQAVTEPTPGEQAVTKSAPGEKAAAEPPPLAGEADKHGDRKENGTI